MSPPKLQLTEPVPRPPLNCQYKVYNSAGFAVVQLHCQGPAPLPCPFQGESAPGWLFQGLFSQILTAENPQWFQDIQRPRPKGQLTHLTCSLRTGSGDRAPARQIREIRVRPHTPTAAGDLRDGAHSPPAETEQKQGGWEAGRFCSSLSGKSFKLEKYSSLSLRKLRFLFSLKV